MEIGLRYLVIGIFFLLNMPNAYANEPGEHGDEKQLCELVKKIEQSCAAQAHEVAAQKERPVKKNILWRVKKLLARASWKKSAPEVKSSELSLTQAKRPTVNTQRMPPNFTSAPALTNMPSHKSLMPQNNTVANTLSVNNKSTNVANSFVGKQMNKEATDNVNQDVDEKINQEVNKKVNEKVKHQAIKKMDVNKSEISTVAMPQKKLKDLTSCYVGADKKSRERPAYCYYMMY